MPAKARGWGASRSAFMSPSSAAVVAQRLALSCFSANSNAEVLTGDLGCERDARRVWHGTRIEVPGMPCVRGCRAACFRIGMAGRVVREVVDERDAACLRL